MAIFCNAKWRTVAGLATGCVALATAATVAAPGASDHVWALTLAVVAAAVVRAASSSGGVRSILCLAGAMVVAQPLMHVLEELTSSHERMADHSALAGLVLLACHLTVFVVLTTLVAAGDTVGRALLARFRRIVRIALRVAQPRRRAGRPGIDAPDSRLGERLHSRLPCRRGPPTSFIAHVQ